MIQEEGASDALLFAEHWSLLSSSHVLYIVSLHVHRSYCLPVLASRPLKRILPVSFQARVLESSSRHGSRNVAAQLFGCHDGGRDDVWSIKHKAHEMIAKCPSSYLQAVSIHHSPRHASIRILSIYRPNLRRQYAQPTRPDIATTKAIEANYSAKAALHAIESRQLSDPINPPRSTLPPPLDLPERNKDQNVALYWFRIGRAYGTFYKEGVKAVWFNNKAAKLLRERIKNELKVESDADAALKGVITRSEWQILQRNNHDMGRLPLFGLLVLVFGEWLPLFVPFMPGVVPGTCRIPKQVRGMREKGEERRRVSFRTANFEPEVGQLRFEEAKERATGEVHKWPMASAEYVRTILQPLRDDQLHHLSTTLGLHSSMWDRVQLYPFRALMRRRLMKRLQYLALDDRLLNRFSSKAKLSQVELEFACEVRGLDVLGRPEHVLRENLEWWLKRQDEDEGRGKAAISMLFRRLVIRDWVGLHLKAANDREQT